MGHDVFISYPHQDKPTADAACAKLEAAGIRCWIAPRDIAPSADWASAIVDAIRECRMLVLIFSESANRSKQVYREVKQAIDKEKPIIPFRIENVSPEKALDYYMSPLHWLDALTPPLEQHLERLVATAGALIRAEVPPKQTSATSHIAEPDVLPSGTIKYALTYNAKLIIGLKTGPIDFIRGVDIWVNSENTEMLMDRLTGNSVSSRIRLLGAERDADGVFSEDTIGLALLDAVGGKTPVPVGSLFLTTPGDLRKTHGVQQILHVATTDYHGSPPPRMLAVLTRKILGHMDELSRPKRSPSPRSKAPRSILLPLIGAGEGDLRVEDVARAMISAALDYLLMKGRSALSEVYFLAYRAREGQECENILQHECASGVLTRVG